MRNRGFVVFFTIAFLLISEAKAYHCGQYLEKTIKTYGGMTCSQAKDIYKAFIDGNLPKGWMCGQSVGGCGQGKKGFTFQEERRS